MKRESFAHAISEIEKRFSRPFVPDRDLRKRLLESAFTQIEGCSEASLLRAADSIMMSNTFIPSPDTLVAAVKKEALADAKKIDDAQEKRAGSYEKYGDRKPLSKNMKDLIKVMNGGKVTRQEWNLFMQQMYREEKPQDLLGPTAYAALCERQGLDMDAPAFSGGLSELLTEK